MNVNSVIDEFYPTFTSFSGINTIYLNQGGRGASVKRGYFNFG